MIRFVFAALLGSAAAIAGPACGGHGDAKSLLVSTEWLAAHTSDAKVALLAVGDPADYARSHIPGAAYLRSQDLSSRLSPLTLELPPMIELTETFRALGVGNDSHIVIYTGRGARFIQATRVYLTLDAMGLGAQTSILDGGMAAWESEKRPLSTETPAPKRSTLTPCEQSDVITDSAYLAANLGHRGIDIVDARAPEFYSGESTANGKRSGHIPGAINLPFTTMVDAQGKLYSADTLREMFHRAGIQTGDRVVSYCHIGLQATMVYFTARYLGFDARLYDGSWEDWSAHQNLPAETAIRH